MRQEQESMLNDLRILSEMDPNNVLLNAAYNATDEEVKLYNSIKQKDQRYPALLINFYAICIAHTKYSNEKFSGGEALQKKILFSNCLSILVLKLCDYYEEQIVTAERASASGLKRFAKRTGIALHKWVSREKWTKDANLMRLWEGVLQDTDDMIDEFVTFAINLSDRVIDRCAAVEKAIKRQRGVEELCRWKWRDVYSKPSSKRRAQDMDNNEEEYYSINNDAESLSWLYFFRLEKNSPDSNRSPRPDDVIDPREIVARLIRIDCR